MAPRSNRNYKFLTGVDANIDISLEEYGLVWFDDPSEDEIDFFYGIGLDESSNYNRFDNICLNRYLDPKQEWSWIEDWGDVASILGISAEEFLKLPLTWMVYELIGYYGYRSVCGETYWGAWFWNKNLQRFQKEDPKEVIRVSHMKRGHVVKEDPNGMVLEQ